MERKTKKRMKVLFVHSFKILGDWNHRLKRQTDLMAQRCELKVLGLRYGDDWLDEIRDMIREFNPDIVYVNGFMVASEILKIFDKVVYDMGSWRTRNILIDDYRITYKDMRKMNIEQLREMVNRKRGATDFQKEDRVLKRVKEIIIWESEEAGFVEKIHDVKVNQVSMMFYDLPEPIRWEDKEDYVIAVSAKWGDRQKNHRLITHLNGGISDERYRIHSIGHSGNSERFMEHSKLMDRVNKSKVVFCPYFCGGIGVVNEGLRLGCNVIVGDWYPYRTYTNDGITISSSGDVKEDAKDCIARAMERYYSPKKELPIEEGQLNKILKICEQVIK